MPRRVALVSCVKSKRDVPTRAQDLYTSTLFRLMRGYAERNADAWYILSAEHGVLAPTTVTAPYEKTLNKMPAAEREQWAADVLDDLERVLEGADEVVILAGMKYRENLVPALRQRGLEVSVPLEGLPFGKQLQRLKELELGA